MEADVVVVGGGGSGLAAAIGAAEAGADVILLEKNPACGGTTARSIGSISAAGTVYQRRLGITDTPEEHDRDVPLFNAHSDRPDNDALRKVLTGNVPDTLEWLRSIGVEFYGPLPEPPHAKPRMHNVVPNSRAYIYHLERRARAIGVRIVLEACATGLVRKEGRVTGVECTIAGGAAQTAVARRGVVLAAGDYAANPEMKSGLISEAIGAVQAVNPTATGDGIRLGMQAGGRIINPDLFGGGIRFVRPPQPSWISRLPPSRWLMRPVSGMLQRTPPAILRRFVMGFLTTVMVPELSLFAEGAILINREGARFADESRPLMLELARQPGGEGYILLDAALAAKYSQAPHHLSTAPGFAFAYLPDYRRNRPDLVHEAPTLEALAVRLGADPSLLVSSVDAYNGPTDGGARVPARGDRPPLGAGPYVALGPVQSFVNYTDGGLAVNQRLQVLGPGDVPVPGLYAAGSNGQGGLLLKGHGHHLGWAFTSGRLAGGYAARGIGG